MRNMCCDCGKNITSKATRCLACNTRKTWIGKRFSEKHRKNLSKSQTGKTNEKCSAWKGDKAGYSALHKWLRKFMGKPNKCAKCEAKEVIKVRTNIQWANISKKYIRKKEDWIALCASCHKLFDLGKITI